MSANFAGSFAPYTPPPDDPSRLPPKSVSRPGIWFPENPVSYQSGSLPPSTTVLPAAAASTDIERGQHHEWETTYGLRVDVLAAFAYLLGPISGSAKFFPSIPDRPYIAARRSALALLVLETHNDYVRFHAYQAALLMTPLLTAHILAAILQLPSWIHSFLTLLLYVSGFLMAAKAFLGASGGRLSRFRLPKLGFLADQWVDEE